MRRKVVILLVTLALIGVAAYFGKNAANVPPPAAMPADGALLYENRDLGISFEYPKGYVKAEGPVGDTGAYAVELVREEDAVMPEDGEGPRSVSVRAYPSGGKALEEWLASAKESNHFGAATSSATVAGAPAIAYPWEGLYQGKTTALMHRGRVLLVTVTYDRPDDVLLDAYGRVLSSFRLQ